MTREELQQKLQELATRKKEAFRRYEARLLAIQEAQQAALREINERKFAYLATLSHDRGEVNRKMRADSMTVRTELKLENITLENEREQLFADYKAQENAEPGTETESDDNFADLKQCKVE